MNITAALMWHLSLQWCAAPEQSQEDPDWISGLMSCAKI